MKIFVAGAAGCIGSAVVKSLVARGHSVIGAARDKTAAEKSRAARVKPVTVDLSDAKSFVAIAKNHGAALEALPTDDARRAMGLFAHALALDPFVESSRLRTILGRKPGGPGVRDDIARGGA